MQRRPRRAVALAVLALAALAAGARAADQFPPQEQVSLTFQPGPEGRGGQGALRLATRGLPAGTVVLLEMSFDGEPIPQSWVRERVAADGKLNLPIGPFERSLLPGAYQLRLVVDPQRQDPRLAASFSDWKAPLQATYSLSWQPESAATRRAELRQQLLQLVQGASALLDEVLAAGDAYRDKKRWRTSDRFDQADFLRWAGTVIQRIAEAQAARQRIDEQWLVPCYPHLVRFEVKDLYLFVRIVAVDYTVFPILRHQKLAVPDEFKPYEGISIKPDREQSIGKARQMLADIDKALSEQAGSPLLELLPGAAQLPAGYAPGDPGGLLTGLVADNPGTTSQVDAAALERLAQRLGVRLPASDVQELAALALSAGPTQPPVGVYVLRFAKQLYAEFLVQQLRNRAGKGAWHGQVLTKGDLVVVVDAGATSGEAEAARKLAAHFSGEHRFQSAR